MCMYNLAEAATSGTPAQMTKQGPPGLPGQQLHSRPENQPVAFNIKIRILLQYMHCVSEQHQLYSYTTNKHVYLYM